MGAGMVGMFVVNMLKIAGVNPIIALDLDENKLELAKEFGATHTFKSSDSILTKKIRELTKNRGADFGFELVGNLKPEVTIPLQKVGNRD